MNTPRLRHSRGLLFGVGVIALFVMSLLLSFTVGRKVPLRHYTYVKAAFNDVAGLRVGDDVREHSVRIGQVSAISLKQGQAVTTLQLDGTRHVYRAAHAVLRARSSLGQTYVDLTPGNRVTGALSANGIPVASTTGQTQLDDVLNVFDKGARSNAAQVIATTGGGAAGHQRDINDFLGSAPDLLRDLGSVSTNAATARTDLPSLLKSSDQLSARFAGREKQLAALISASDTTLAAVATEDGVPLDRSIRELPGTLRAARSGLSALDAPLADTGSALTALTPGATALAAVTPSLRATLRNVVAPLVKVPGVAHQALPAVTSLTRTARDLRPLAPKVTKALRTGQQPLSVLAPYGLEAGVFFEDFASTLAGVNPDGTHFVRIDALFTSQLLSGNVPGLSDPLSARDPYPAPGKARGEHTGTTAPGSGVVPGKEK